MENEHKQAIHKEKAMIYKISEKQILQQCYFTVHPFTLAKLKPNDIGRQK